ncbi:MAG TPA: UDP-N-acetylmuramate dehydrogenase [Saprospiraceae bacterium]|nr:UDP-N-acetylmuramate dehydrogenase [Saprospiraceae bacterium]
MRRKDNFNLYELNTFRLDVVASKIYFPESYEEVREVVEEYPDAFILGGGSNILFATDRLERPVIAPEIMGIEKLYEDEAQVIVSSGAGEAWQALVDFTLDHNWGGLENLSLIPGKVGAAPIQNIGAYGVEFKEVFFGLEAVRIKDGALHTFNKDMCEFDYRYSAFKGSIKGQYIITRVYIKLRKDHQINTSYGGIKMTLNKLGLEKPSFREMADAINYLRRSKLPYPDQIPNAGSFFKNPIVGNKWLEDKKCTYTFVPHYRIDDQQVKIPAAWLLEQAGFKGYRAADAGFYEKHALILVNHGRASGEELWSLAQKARKEVETKFGLLLEPEVNIIEA